MSIYQNKAFRMTLGIVLCFSFIKLALWIGRTYLGTMMFLAGTYLFFFYTFFSIIDGGIEKAGVLHEKYNYKNINKQPLIFFMKNKKNIVWLYKLPFNLLYIYCVIKHTLNTFF
ncbi:hypothetical protein DQ02_08670 [Citrobacter amalonaticus]|nr:hypothetical protein DQ02_08670 [Citrobacter amalonaticus]